MVSTWTNDRIKFLEDNYYSQGADFCAIYLQCSKGTIYSKAQRLGLKSSRSKLKTHEEYLKELSSNNIPYTPLDRYINALTKIPHMCKNNHIWDVTPSKLLNGKGCPECSGMLKKTTDTYIEALLEKDINIAPAEKYINVKTHILHECLDCGHIWNATPNKILMGRGCPSCAEYGFNADKPAILYYIKIVSYHQEVYYKIGITNRTIKDRFFRDRDKTIKILLQKEFELGTDARLEEQSILSKYKDKRVTVPDFLKSGGNTELFEIDILGLDP